MEKVKYIYVENERQKLNDMLRTRKVALKIGGEDIVGIESFGVIMNTNYLESLANSEDPYGFIFIEALVKKGNISKILVKKDDKTYQNMYYQIGFKYGIDMVFINNPECDTYNIRSLLTRLGLLCNARNVLITLNSLRFTRNRNELRKAEIRQAKSKIAKEEGRKLPGVQKGTKRTTKRSLEVKDQMRTLLAEKSYTHDEMMDIVQVSHNTFYKYLKEIRKEDEERLRKENAKNPRMEELREFMDDTKA